MIQHDLFGPFLYLGSGYDFINYNWTKPTVHESNKIFKLIGDNNISEVNHMYYLATDFVVYFS